MSAGDWPVNCESIAFSFVGDYRQQAPSEEQLAAIARLARPYDDAIGGKLMVQLHSEVAEQHTACPARVVEGRERLIQLISGQSGGGGASWVDGQGKARVKARAGLNIRKGPSSAAPSVTIVPNGTVLDFVGYSDEGEPVNGDPKWFRNVYGNWFSAHFVTVL
jgi:hypothetical protein